MKRISDGNFIAQQYDADKVVGIRVKNGEFYFLAWMENAPHYKIQQATNPNGYLLDRCRLMFDGDIYNCIIETEGYNNMYLLYETDDEGKLLHAEDKVFANAHEKFLTLINCYERNGTSDPYDHDILILTKDELGHFCDLLRDGDYILIVEDM